MHRHRKELWLCATALTFAQAPAQAQTTTADKSDQRIAALEAQVRALTQIVQTMRASAQAPAAAAVAASTTPSIATEAVSRPAQAATFSKAGQANVSIAGGKPMIQSADGRFTANLHGVMQFDAAGYFQQAAGPVATDLRRGGGAGDTAHARDLNSGTNFRRARFGMDGRLFGDFDYNVLLEFGGTGAEDAGHIQELWLQYSGLKPFKLRIGAFAPSIGLEDQNSTNGMPLLERPAISDIARGIAGGDYREGMQLTASHDRWYAAVAVTTRTVGTINSTASGTAQSFDQNLGGIVRVAAIPLKGADWMIHVGAHASRVFSVADAGGPDATSNRYPVELRERPELRVDGTRLIDTGQINASHVDEGGLELAGQKGPFYAQGEYERIVIERRDSPLSNPRFSGWYAEGGLMLTGEQRKYNTGTFAFDGPAVAHPFDPRNGQWGAFELAGRYSVADLNYHQGLPGQAAPADGIRGGEQKILAAGINWYLNPAIRFMLDYQHVNIDRLSPSASTYATPVGAQIGQSYNAVSVRSQLAF